MFNFGNVCEKSLSKDFILSKVSQKEIIEFYLKRSLPEKGEFVKSVFRGDDETPSLSFKEMLDGTVIFNDWGRYGYSGDAFKFIMLLKNVTFYESLQIINNDIILNLPSNYTKNINFELSPIEAKIKPLETILVEKQGFNIVDYKYWGLFNITIDTLKLFNVSSCKKLWLYDTGNSKYFLLRQYSNSQPMYCYEYTNVSDNGVVYKTYKIYRPLSDKKSGKFYFSGSSSNIEGYDQLPLIDDLLIITKSLKDVMCLYSFGISAISLQGEGNKLNEKLFLQLKERFENIVVFYDNDEQGIKSANEISREYGIKNIFIKNDIKAKDISDTIRDYGSDFAFNYLKNLLGEEWKVK